MARKRRTLDHQPGIKMMQSSRGRIQFTGDLKKFHDVFCRPYLSRGPGYPAQPHPTKYFGEKKFWYFGWTATKQEAEGYKAKLKGKGLLCRITRERPGYAIWYNAGGA